jgi:hypothetical protein
MPIPTLSILRYFTVYFSYGQTGSGKSHTIHGPSDATEADAPLRGLLPRSLEYIFANIADREGASDGAIKYSCRATFIEIYNERIYE